jgi:hypothetical protein
MSQAIQAAFGFEISLLEKQVEASRKHELILLAGKV